MKRSRESVPSFSPVEQNEPISAFDIVNLGLFSLFGQKPPGSSAQAPKFIRLNAPHAVEHWVYLYAPGLESEPFLNSVFDVCVETNSPGSKYALHPDLRDLQSVPVKKQKAVDEPCTLTDLLLDPRLAPAIGFPATGFTLSKIVGKNRAFGLDCEMCLCGTKSVLTRVAIVDFSSEETVLDELVKPDLEITEYLTPFSGITKEMLDPVKTTLADVIEKMQSLVGLTDVLIGHSLDSDFRALGLTHTKIVDTSVLFPHPFGLPKRLSLKSLMKQYLHIDIQTSNAGHAPTEDALACIQLVKLKLEKGLQFGVPLFEKGAPLTQFLNSNEFRAAIIDSEPPVWDLYGTGSHVIASTPSSTAQLALKMLKTHAFVFAGLYTATSSVEAVRKAVVQIMKRLPPKCLVSLYTGANPEQRLKVNKLLTQRRLFKTEHATKKWDEIKDLWTEKDDKLLEEAVAKARAVKSYFCMTISDKDFASLSTELQKANKHGRRAQSDESDEDKELLPVPKKQKPTLDNAVGVNRKLDDEDEKDKEVNKDDEKDKELDEKELDEKDEKDEKDKELDEKDRKDGKDEKESKDSDQSKELKESESDQSKDSESDQSKDSESDQSKDSNELKELEPDLGEKDKKKISLKTKAKSKKLKKKKNKKA